MQKTCRVVKMERNYSVGITKFVSVNKIGNLPIGLEWLF